MIHLFKEIALTLLITVSFQTSAQNTISETKVDSLLQVLHLPDLDSLILVKGEAELHRVEVLWRKNNRSIKKNTLLKLFQKIERFAVANKNSDLEMKAAIWLFDIKQDMYSQTETTLGYKKLIKRAGVSNVFWAEMEAIRRFANYLIGTKNPQSIETGFWILKENIDKINKKEDVNLSRLLLENYIQLISCYYRMGDLSNAIIYSKKALDIKYPRGHTKVSDEIRLNTVVLNNLGVFYREQQELDASTYYFRKVLNLSLKENDTVWNAVSSGNLGENLYLQDNFQEALPLLQKDADMTTKTKHWGNASNALILIADIYLREGDIEKAKQTLDKAAFAAHSSKEIKRLSKLYPVLSKYYKTIGQPNIALAYADSTIVALNELKIKYNQFQGCKVESAYNKHQIKIASEKKLKTKNSNIRSRNIGLFLLLFLLFIGYVIFRRFKLKAKQQESKLENNVVQITDKLYLKEEELMNKIQEFTVQNNAVNWRDFKIHSDEEWRSFLILFQKEHPEFISCIKSKFSSITAGEIRLLCLTRLGLDDTAIAYILNVNVNSISQTRRRFMRKLGIENLKEFKGLIFSI